MTTIHPVQQLVVLDPATLATLIKGAVSEALADAAGAPVLLTREALADRLSCSPGHVDALRRRGLPERRLGASAVRFELAECLEWLRTHGGDL